MRSPRRLLALLVALTALSGCARTIRVEGPGECDVYATLPPGSKALALVGGNRGKGGPVVYALPREAEDAKLDVVVRSDRGSWRFVVFTDRDIVITYPPKGPGIAAGAVVEGLLPEEAAANPPAPAPASTQPPAATARPVARPSPGSPSAPPPAQPAAPAEPHAPAEAPITPPGGDEPETDPRAPEEPRASISPE